jgi:hypothetical protein
MFINNQKNYLEKLWEINFQFQLQIIATQVMISLSPIPYSAYFVALKEYIIATSI